MPKAAKLLRDKAGPLLDQFESYHETIESYETAVQTNVKTLDTLESGREKAYRYLDKLSSERGEST